MIDKATIDRIYAAADIVEVVGDFVSLRKKGINYQACCPFHNEKTPSFVVSPTKGLYKCFGCGKGGNAVSFVMEHEGMSYVEALKFVAKKYGIEVAERELTEEESRRNDNRESMMVVNSWAAEWFKNSLHNTDEGRSVGLGYFRGRGISDEMIERFGLGYCPGGERGHADNLTRAALAAGYKEEFLTATGLTIVREQGGYYDRFAERVMFPIHSMSGRVLAFGGRTLRTDKHVAKYQNSPESEVYSKKQTLYGIFFAKKAISQQRNAILVEGYTDVISMHQAGVENVVASSGTSLTVEQIKLLKRFTDNVTVIYDGDSAGINASLRGIDMILREGLSVRVVLLPDGEDPDSFARSHNATELQEFIRTNEQDFITFKAKLLSREAKGDVIKRAAVVGEMVASIAEIPDAIQRAMFIAECARTMEIDESLLTSEVAKKRLSGPGGPGGISRGGRPSRGETRGGGVAGGAGEPGDSWQHAAPDDQWMPDEQWNSYPDPEQREFIQRQQGFDRAEAEARSLTRGRVTVGSSIDELEKELTKYLIKYGHEDFDFRDGRTITPLNIAETIISELDNNGITLRNARLRALYDTYNTIYGEQGRGVEVAAHNFINHPDSDVSGTAVDLLTADDNYVPSKLWKRHDFSVAGEREVLSEALPRAIILYKSKVIEELSAELRARLSDPELNDDESADILRRLTALSQERTAISKRLSRLIL